jgi:hypothetical protein
MTRRLFDVALADEVLAELARQRRTRLDLARSTLLDERTLRRRLRGDGELRAAEVELIAAALGLDVGTLHARAQAAIEAEMSRHPAGSALRA